MCRQPTGRRRGATHDAVLSAHDATELSQALVTLLSPLAHPDVPSWQTAVLRQLKTLLGADMGSFMLPLPGTEPIFSEDIAAGDRQRFPRELQLLDRRFSVWRRQVELGVSHRDTVWQPYLDSYLRSAYYDEYIVPGRFFDALILNVQVGEEAGPGGVAGLWFHHERRSGPAFGARGEAILRLALPAFRAGVLTLKQVAAARSSLGRTLDAVGQAVALFGPDGEVRHRTPALLRLLADDPERDLLEAEMRSAAADVARITFRRPCTYVERHAVVSVADPSGAVPARRIVTTRGVYRVAASLGGSELEQGDPTVLVTVDAVASATHSPLPSPLELADRFGLTRREAAIALLIAQGHGTGAIAAQLGISAHTVRRHTEQVFRKLDVHSRAAVGPRLREVGGTMFDRA